MYLKMTRYQTKYIVEWYEASQNFKVCDLGHSNRDVQIQFYMACKLDMTLIF